MLVRGVAIVKKPNVATNPPPSVSVTPELGHVECASPAGAGRHQERRQATPVLGPCRCRYPATHARGSTPPGPGSAVRGVERGWRPWLALHPAPPDDPPVTRCAEGLKSAGWKTSEVPT